jgi:hypothetical protein
MSYIKLQKTGAEFDLVSADNIGDIKLSSGDVVINYLSGYKVTITGGVSGTNDFVQKDINKIENAVDVMSGASGPAPMTILGFPVTGVTAAVGLNPAT